jgi:hypothetical protein
VLNQVSLVGGVLFHLVLLQKFQGDSHPMPPCIIGIDDQFSIVSADLSFAPFEQWNNDISKVMTYADFDSL